MTERSGSTVLRLEPPMPIPRVEHLGLGVSEHFDMGEPQRTALATLTLGWERVDGETDSRTLAYEFEGGLTDAERVDLAEVQVVTPGFTVRLDVGHVYLGSVVLRAWAELSDDVASPGDESAHLEIRRPYGNRLTVTCHPDALPLFQRVGDRMLRPAVERTLASVIRALSEPK